VAGLDEAEWVEQYVKLERPLYNVVYRWVWDSAESQDIVQEAFLRCWRIRERVDPERLQALVFTTALRLASNQRRRRKLWRWVTLNDEHLAEDVADTAAGLAGRHVRSALEELPDSLRRVLLLSELAGMSYKEIAAVMNIREGSVGSRRSRALSRLRQNLETRGVRWDED